MTARCLLILAWLGLALPAYAETFDVVLSGGRVMDPETGLDAVRNVGISHGKIARITVDKLVGKQVLDARGLVVAPGFIDLHQHAQDLASGRLKAFDGVTSGLEMEIGVPDVGSFLKQKQGRSLINYGTTASHPAARALAFGAPLHDPLLIPQSGPSTNDPATPAQLDKMESQLRAELDAGALGIGMGIQYTPGATRLEVIRMFRLAAERRVPVFTHVRSFGRLEPGSSIEAVSEVIGAAAVTGASLQIVHINSSCLSDAPECLNHGGGRSRTRTRCHDGRVPVRGRHDDGQLGAVRRPLARKIGRRLRRIASAGFGRAPHEASDFEKLHAVARAATGADFRQYRGDGRPR